MVKKRRLTVLTERRGMYSRIRQSTTLPALIGWALLSGCAPVGPDFVKPDEPANAEWSEKEGIDVDWGKHEVWQNADNRDVPEQFMFSENDARPEQVG